jgi:dihydroxy-acid dehydratase
MYTANTMAAAAEALGMSLPGSATIPAVDEAKARHMRASARALLAMLERGIKPRDIMTRNAFENAIRTVMALGGSTNAVLHLIALAREAGSSSRPPSSTISTTLPRPSRT